MNVCFQCFAIALWIISLFLPTVPLSSGAHISGFWLLVEATKGAVMIPYSLMYPGHLASYATNLLILREIIVIVPPHHYDIKPLSLVTFVTAFLFNGFMGLSTIHSKESGPVPLPAGLLELPGFYVWLSAFFFLTLARILGPKSDSTEEAAAGIAPREGE